MEQVKLDFRVCLFGNLEIEVGGVPIGKTRTKKERALFALLALRNGAPTDREWLARTLWPDSLLEQSRSNLRRSLCDLGRALGPLADRLSARSGELSFDFSRSKIDVVEFDQAVTDRTPHSLRRAIQLHHAPLLATFDDDWARRERAVRLDAYLSIVEALVTWGDPREGAALLQGALIQDPTNERILRKLVETLSQGGGTAAALQAYGAWADRLQREFDGKPSAETVSLVNGLRLRPRLPTEPARPVLVPDYGTRVFGRETEMVQLALALKESSGVTLMGLPGVGKTRLAVELARGSSAEFLDGVYLVEAGRTTFHSFVDRCAAALDIGTTATPELLGQFLRRRNALLVVDDVDSDLPAIAAFLSTLTGKLSRCRVLATSRRPLDLPGAQLFHVAPLDSVSTAEEFSPAAKMFENRARLVNPEFVLTVQNAESVRAICSKLDGIPLAIEIAATWTESLPLSTIDSRLGVRLARDTIAIDAHSKREKTLTAAFEECLDHLGVNELHLLQHAAPFEDGWSLSAAMKVCDLSETDVVLALGGLVHKSLASLDRGTERYRMLDTTREIVVSRLTEEDRERCRQAFALYYRDQVLALDANPDGYFENLPDDRMLGERRNLESAVSWWQVNDPDMAVRLQFLLFHWRVLPIEGSGWIERLTQGEEPPAGLEPMVYSCAGFSAFWVHHPGALELLRKAAQTACAAGQPQWEAHAQNALSLHHQRQGQYREAAACETAVAQAARRANMPFLAELSIASHGFLSWRQGIDGSVDSLRRQLTRGHVTRDWRARYAALRALCGISKEAGEYERASAYAEELAPLAREHCHHELSNILLWCAEIDRKQGNTKRAGERLEEAVQFSQERRTPEREAAALQELSLLAEQKGELAEAEAYLMRACQIFEARNSPQPLADLTIRRAELALVANMPSKARDLLELALGIADEWAIEWGEEDRGRIARLRQQVATQRPHSLQTGPSVNDEILRGQRSKS